MSKDLFASSSYKRAYCVPSLETSMIPSLVLPSKTKLGSLVPVPYGTVFNVAVTAKRWAPGAAKLNVFWALSNKLSSPSGVTTSSTTSKPILIVGVAEYGSRTTLCFGNTAKYPLV